MPIPAPRRLRAWLPGRAANNALGTAGDALAGLVLLLAASTIVAWVYYHSPPPAAVDNPLVVPVAQNLAQVIDRVDGVLKVVTEGLAGTDTADIATLERNGMLMAEAKQLPNLLFLQVLDSIGNVVASAQPVGHPSNWAGRDYFAALSSHPGRRLEIGKPISPRDPDNAGITLSRGILHPDGSFAGLAVVGLNLAFARDAFAGLALDGRDSILLLAGDGEVLARWPVDPNAVAHVIDVADPLMRALRSGAPRVVAEDPIDRLPRDFTIRRLGSLPLFVALGHPPAAATGRIVPAWLGLLVLLSPLAAVVWLVLRLRHHARLRRRAEQEGTRRGRLFATMSHELRAPLHGILGYAEQLRDAGGLSPEQAHRLEAMISAGQMLREVINRLLDYWRLEARGPALRMQSVDMPSLFEDCRAVVEPEARLRSIDLRCRLEPEAPRHVTADGTWLRQIIVNLLSNAVKFTAVGRVELHYSGDAAQVHIAVADTGPGISAADHARLFHEYERLERDDTLAEGTGLGLSIAERLARLMGGRIEHRDNPGGGSIFTLHLPSGVPLDVPAAASIAPTGEAAATPMHPLTVLLVDDSPTHRDIARNFLQRAGHRAVEASGGEEAVRLAADAEFDLVLLDMSMPGISGLETARRLRALGGARGVVPIIAVTANALDEDRERYRRAGLNGYVAKPFTEAELARALAAAAASRTIPWTDAVPTVALLDRDTLDGLAAALGEERIERHLATLDATVTELLRTLEDEAAADDGTPAELAHRVAGDAGQLGFMALSHAARAFMVARQEATEDAALAASLTAVAHDSLALLRQRRNASRAAATAAR